MSIEKESVPHRRTRGRCLIDTRTRFEFNEGAGPVGVYKCEDCGYYHFTSKGPMNERLAIFLKGHKASIQREANKWLDKFKKK